MVRGKLVFISGGARSGKSAYAERQLIEQARRGGGRLVYIASGVATDAEMQERIDQHRRDRKSEYWHTIESPVNLHNALPELQRGDFVLWDCATTWLTNELYEGFETGSPCWERQGCLEHKLKQVVETIHLMMNKVAQLTIVSNEVLDEFIAYSKETEVYRRAIGQLNKQLVAMADTAIEMDYGLPAFWKREGKVIE